MPLSRRAWVGGAATLVTLATVACGPTETIDGVEVGQRRPLAVELRFALLADRHPWVMAMVTTYASASDDDSSASANVEVDLGSRVGAAGNPAPDPMILADGREDLTRLLEHHEQTRRRPADIRPVWLPTPEAPEAGARLHFVQLGPDSETAIGSGAQVSLEKGYAGPEVHVHLSRAQADAAEAIANAHVGGRIVVTLADEVLLMVTVSRPVDPGGLRAIAIEPAEGESAVALLNRLSGA